MKLSCSRLPRFSRWSSSPSIGAFLFALVLAGVGGLGSGCSDKETDAPGKVVPRPATQRADAGPQNAILDECSQGDECTGAATCSGTCGLHELGDRACTCGNNELTCTACTLNVMFKPEIRDATALCAMGTRDDAACPLKGDTCMNVTFSNSGVARREACLCWMGRTQLQWDCSGTLNGFFLDMAPPNPPPPVRPDAGSPDGAPEDAPFGG